MRLISAESLVQVQSPPPPTINSVVDIHETDLNVSRGADRWKNGLLQIRS
jgi:hypothetical protein